MAQLASEAGMDAWQDCRCAMCGTYGATVRDHDHATGLIRGLLCHGCNVHEGMGHDLFEGWRTGDNPAGKYGWYIQYVSPWPVQPSLNDQISYHLAAATFSETKSWRSGLMLAKELVKVHGAAGASTAVRNMVYYAHTKGACAGEIADVLPGVGEDDVRAIVAAMVEAGVVLPESITSPPVISEFSRRMMRECFTEEEQERHGWRELLELDPPAVES